MKKETYEPSQLHNELPDAPQPQSPKKVSKNNIVIGVVVGILLIAGVAIWNNPRVQHWGEPRAAKLTVVNEEQFKEKLLEFWRYKYEEEFVFLGVGNKDPGYCFFGGRATSPSIPGEEFIFRAGVYEDGSVFCEDEYFAFTIRDEYEAYMADLLREFLPEEFKIYQRYSLDKFKELDKKISFEEFLERYRGKYTDIGFSIYVLETKFKWSEAEEKGEEIAKKLFEKGYVGSIFVRTRDEENYRLLARNDRRNFSEQPNENTILIKMFEKKYEVIVDREE